MARDTQEGNLRMITSRLNSCISYLGQLRQLHDTEKDPKVRANIVEQVKQLQAIVNEWQKAVAAQIARKHGQA